MIQNKFEEALSYHNPSRMRMGELSILEFRLIRRRVVTPS